MKRSWTAEIKTMRRDVARHAPPDWFEVLGDEPTCRRLGGSAIRALRKTEGEPTARRALLLALWGFEMVGGPRRTTAQREARLQRARWYYAGLLEEAGPVLGAEIRTLLREMGIQSQAERDAAAEQQAAIRDLIAGGGQ
jgi:hypothetical protein